MADQQRLSAVLEKMQERNLECLIAYSNGIHSLLESNAVVFLSDFKSLGQSMVLLRSDGTSTLLLTPAWDTQRAVKRSTATQTLGTDNLMKTFRELGEAENLFSRHVGFIGCDGLNQADYTLFSSLFKTGLNRVDEMFLDLTQSKSESEINRTQKATWIAERGYEKMLEVARPGIFEYQLAGEIESFMKSLGADDNFLLMSASQHNYSVRPPGRRRLEKGDIILAEISPSYEGQFTQICRSVVLGDDAHGRLKEKYDLLIDAMEKGISSARAGEKMSNVFRAINEPLVKAGYEKYCCPPYMRVRGHGLGIGSILPGDVSDHNDRILKEGMFFVIHPNQYIPESGYLLCGEPVLITSNGGKALTKRKPALDFLSD